MNLNEMIIHFGLTNITKENEPNIEDNQNILSTPPITNISLEELKDLK